MVLCPYRKKLYTVGCCIRSLFDAVRDVCDDREALEFDAHTKEKTR